jgi:hypothetical protein
VASDGKGRVQSYSLRCSGTYALGAYTTLLLDRPSTSPCNDKVVINILRCKGGATDPMFLLPDLGQRVAVRGRVNKSFWAGTYYRQQRAKGSSYQAAVRALAFKWIRNRNTCQVRLRPHAATESGPVHLVITSP